MYPIIAYSGFWHFMVVHVWGKQMIIDTVGDFNPWGIFV